MAPELLLRVAAAYHGLLALVGLALPRDLLRFLGLEPPTRWLTWALSAAGALALALCLELARRRPELRRGLVLAVVVAEVCCGVAAFAVILWSSLPAVLYGPALAAGLWAFLLYGVYAPERAGGDEG